MHIRNIIELTKSFGFGNKPESLDCFDLKSETESLKGFRFSFGMEPPFMHPNPESFKVYSAPKTLHYRPIYQLFILFPVLQIFPLWPHH